MRDIVPEKTLTVREFSQIAGIHITRAYEITKLADKTLRPPGYKVGREYRIWEEDLHGYLHDGRFADAMEAVA